METPETSQLFDALSTKGELKQLVYRNALAGFEKLNVAGKFLLDTFQHLNAHKDSSILFEMNTLGDFGFQIKFAGDILVFYMHTNIFEFSRDHEVMRSLYIREEKERSYCGVIHVYNFLADSFKYNRDNDLGYLIGRIFINKDNHYFIEGKRELGQIYNNFDKSVFDDQAALGVVKSAMLYAINFDLLSPPYDEVKMVTVAAMKNAVESMKIVTGKRLGFRFQADSNNMSD
jgi:hypothetical protein